MIKATRKVEIKFPGERITQSRVLEDGSCELVVEIVVNEESREYADVREQSEICEEMNDVPKTERKKNIELLIKTVKNGSLPELPRFVSSK